MLGDRPRLDAYAAALEHSAPGNVVLDVGCGTGILSLLAARAGARKVYALESNAELASLARTIVDENGLGSTIDVVHGDAASAALPEQADVLVSEWMGFHLLHENMLEAVLAARDRHLKPEGVMLPSQARVVAAPVDMSAQTAEMFGFWQDVRGFDMSAAVPRVAAALQAQPLVQSVPEAALLAAPQVVGSLELGDRAALRASEPIAVHGQCGFPCATEGVCHGFALWFECDFPGGARLSTAPAAPATHWAQSVVFLPEMLAAAPGYALDCAIRVAPDEENPRWAVIDVQMG